MLSRGEAYVSIGVYCRVVMLYGTQLHDVRTGSAASSADRACLSLV